MYSVFSSCIDSCAIQVAIITLVMSVSVYKLVKQLTSDEKPPPGPWGFPIVGYLPLLGKEPNITFMKMREKFGDIFQIQMGSWPTVVVNGKRAIREALQDSGDDFSGRPQFVSSEILSNGESLSLGQFNEKWKILRKITSKVLNEYSRATKTPVQEMVEEEVDILVNAFMSHAGESFNPRVYMFLSCTSIIYQICYGREKGIRESKSFTTFIMKSGEFPNFLKVGNPIDIMPWLRFIMPWKLQRFSQFIETLKVFRRDRVDEHKKEFSPDHLRDITDGMLAASKGETRLTEERIFGAIDAIFGAGFDTVTSKLLWALLLMAAHPDVQKRVQVEIDDIVGDGRRPGIQDRSQLVYTEAVLHEINRFVAIEPLALPHSTTRDTKLGGYSIKKDSIVYINLFSMSHDKDVWGDPDVFRPERFLDDGGKIKKSLTEEFLPFSAGRRKCPGEPLARFEIFLFITGLLQRCSILKPPEVSDYSMDIKFGLLRECLPYNIQVKLRI